MPVSNDLRREPGSLSTPRLDLLVLPDAFSFAVFAGDLVAAEAALGVPLGGWPEEPELSRAFPIYVSRLRDDPGVAPWQGRAIWVRDERVVAGSVNLKGRPQHGRAEIGYGLLAPCRGHGYAREAVGAVVEWALAQPGCDEVVATIHPTNRASVRVAEAVGLEPTGVRSQQHEGALIWSTRARAAGTPAR